jgi:hypothetical protein
MIIVERNPSEKESHRYHFEYVEGALMLTKYVEGLRTNKLTNRYAPVKSYKTPEMLAKVSIPESVAFDAMAQFIAQTPIQAPNAQNVPIYAELVKKPVLDRVKRHLNDAVFYAARYANGRRGAAEDVRKIVAYMEAYFPSDWQLQADSFIEKPTVKELEATMQDDKLDQSSAKAAYLYDLPRAKPLKY